LCALKYCYSLGSFNVVYILQLFVVTVNFQVCWQKPDILHIKR